MFTCSRLKLNPIKAIVLGIYFAQFWNWLFKMVAISGVHVSSHGHLNTLQQLVCWQNIHNIYIYNVLHAYMIIFGTLFVVTWPKTRTTENDVSTGLFTRAFTEQGKCIMPVSLYSRAPPGGTTENYYLKHYNTPPPLNSNILRIQINLLI